ncbi:MAG TPA: TerB family tellurite resistance protein [Candidatus Pelagibacter bacterium]|jgi:uncharacterized tellurite resistance protein B-like protein|nr:Tellurite resistance protein TerB [Pelagibacteraceae bacterium]HJN84016.1 TerB family tellurite resistance protein [Candidatus Pelagibacter bacterium]|tara:strand:- start:101 stop:526 length:426 start_codon:yes stop_codon:yes gene_type:complete
MLDFLKKKNKEPEKLDIISKTASLLIHAAKIDENYTNKEKLIIERTLIELSADKEKIDQIMQNAEENEKNSNQILDFTKDIKCTDQNFKIKIIESLWKIIYSDNSSDMYEANLMRRLSGLLYLDNKLVGDIKEKIKRNFNK